MASASCRFEGLRSSSMRAAGNHRRIGLRHSELLEQPVHIRVGFQIHPREQDRDSSTGNRAPGTCPASSASRSPAGPVKLGDSRRSCRRAMNACRMISLMVGHWFRTRRRALPGDLVHLAVAPRDGADDGG